MTFLTLPGRLLAPTDRDFMEKRFAMFLVQYELAKI
jgi:hypothetical protein